MAQAPAKFRIFAAEIILDHMKKFRVPNTYVIIFAVIAICAISTWFVPGGDPQTWQVFSALYEGFSQQAGIIAFVLIIGGAFWLVNSTKAVDEGIMAFISKVGMLEKHALVRKVGAGNIVIVLVMLLFGLFGAVFGMSEETIAFVIDNESKPRKTKVQSLTNNIEISQEQSYIFDPKFPYWIIYRNLDFDKVFPLI